MSYKIFACDLDGTLLDDNSNVSKDNFDAIEQMTKDYKAWLKFAYQYNAHTRSYFSFYQI